MKLLHYYVDFSNVPLEQRNELLEQLEFHGYAGFNVNPIKHCGDLLLGVSVKPEEIINIPKGCIFKQIS